MRNLEFPSALPCSDHPTAIRGNPGRPRIAGHNGQVTGKGFKVPTGEVHVWWASLDVDGRTLTHMEGLLDDRELERAARFRVVEARRRFIAARAVLRSVVGELCDTEPAAVLFAYGERGKPRLVDGRPHFHASDSGDFVVVARADAELGVDLEVLRPLPRRERLARRICTASELAALSRIAAGQRDAALLRLWTCKEAALKAIGVGLAGGVRNVEVELDGGGGRRLERLCGESDGWELLPVDLGPRLACSIVVRGSGYTAITRHFVFPTG